MRDESYFNAIHDFVEEKQKSDAIHKEFVDSLTIEQRELYNSYLNSRNTLLSSKVNVTKHLPKSFSLNE